MEQENAEGFREKESLMDISALIESAKTSVTGLLHSNQVVSGGLVLSAMGATLMYARSLPGAILSKVKAVFTTSVYVDKYDLVGSLNYWLSKNVKHKGNVNSSLYEDEVYLSPGYGKFWCGFYEKSPFWLTHSQIEDGNNGKREVFTISFLTRDRAKPQRFLQTCYAERYLSEPEEVYFYRSRGDSWVSNYVSRGRSFESVILDSQIKEDIVKDMTTFLDSEEWYKSIGIPYRRGYILYGPPGNGKSSLVSCLASHFKKDVYVLRLNDLTDSLLNVLVQQVRRNKILLIEDIDCVVSGRKGLAKADEDGVINKGVSFSGLLNAIDGVDTPDGRILFMTTNKVNDLDSALLRPGRVDYKVEIKNASRNQAEALYRRFFEGSHRALEFGAKIEDYKYSMADLQEHLLTHRNSENLAISQPIKQHLDERIYIPLDSEGLGLSESDFLVESPEDELITKRGDEVIKRIQARGRNR